MNEDCTTLKWLPQPVPVLWMGIAENIEQHLYETNIRMIHYLEENTLCFYSLSWDTHITYKFNDQIQAMNRSVLNHIEKVLKAKFLKSVDNQIVFNRNFRKMQKTYPYLAEWQQIQLAKL